MRRTAQAIFASLTSASLEDVRNQLEGLALFFPQLRRTPEEQRVWVHTWMEDLKDMPRDLLAEACRLWRLQPFPKGEARFPTPGQLIALVDRVLSHRRALAIRAKLALDAFDHSQG